MNLQEARTRLDRVLHTKITSAEWAFLEDRGLIHDYEINGDWPEFRDSVKDNLNAIRRFRENDLRGGEGELEVAPDGESVDHSSEPEPVDLGDRALARFHALDAWNNLHSGGSAPSRPTITGTFLPRGGVDGTVPQWVGVIAAELWTPAEDVARSFRAMQRDLMAEDKQTRTRARAFDVAAFVWRAEAHYGERPPWTELCRLWNDSPMTEPFKDSRDFRKYFERGAEATMPCYKATDEEITRQVREASDRGGYVAFDLWLSQVLAATVQQDHAR